MLKYIPTSHYPCYLRINCQSLKWFYIQYVLMCILCVCPLLISTFFLPLIASPRPFSHSAIPSFMSAQTAVPSMPLALSESHTTAFSSAARAWVSWMGTGGVEGGGPGWLRRDVGEQAQEGEKPEYTSPSPPKFSVKQLFLSAPEKSLSKAVAASSVVREHWGGGGIEVGFPPS